jgi:3-methyl-2-oxobutanoate hydroxymethyltransferase
VAKKRPTVADIRANKGKYQYSKIHLEDWEELAAAEQAGIDILSIPPHMMLDPRLREFAPTAFVVPGMSIYDHPGTTDEFLRWGYKMVSAGADTVYCPASFQTVQRMANEGIPAIGHVGLIPVNSFVISGFGVVTGSASPMPELLQKGWICLMLRRSESNSHTYGHRTIDEWPRPAQETRSRPLHSASSP